MLFRFLPLSILLRLLRETETIFVQVSIGYRCGSPRPHQEDTQGSRILGALIHHSERL